MSDHFPDELIGVVPLCHMPTIRILLDGGADLRIFNFNCKKSWQSYDLIVEILNLGLKLDLSPTNILTNILKCHAKKNPDLIIDFMNLLIDNNIIDPTDRKICTTLYCTYMEYGRPHKPVMEFMIENFKIRWNRDHLSYTTFANDPILFDIAHKKSGLSDTVALLAICDTLYNGHDMYIDFVDFLSNFNFNVDSVVFCKYMNDAIFSIRTHEFRYLVSIGVDFASNQSKVLKNLRWCMPPRHSILTILQDAGLDFASDEEYFIKRICLEPIRRASRIRWLRENGYAEIVAKYTDVSTENVEFSESDAGAENGEYESDVDDEDESNVSAEYESE
jgi:hypothetical protein